MRLKKYLEDLYLMRKKKSIFENNFPVDMESSYWKPYIESSIFYFLKIYLQKKFSNFFY